MSDERRNVLIIGGTGTLGQTILELIYEKPFNITILSRDELKQKQLKSRFPDIKCVLGDVRDIDSIMAHLWGIDTVFHFAALKHVEIAEENPEECFKVNLQGSLNVAKACIASGVPYCVFSSTDKAVLPINSYGLSKAMSEKFLFHQNKAQNITKFSVFRWGNIVGSRGSVLHYFISSLKEKKEVYITDARMTRFWLNIDDAAKFILDNYETAPTDVAMIPPMKGSKVIKLAELCASYLGLNNYNVKYSGVRPGEKLHEVVFSSHEKCLRSDNIEEYTDEELLSLIDRAAKL